MRYLLCLAGLLGVWLDAAEVKFRSAKAIEAKKRYELALERAAQDYVEAFEVALNEALNARNVEEVQMIRDVLVARGKMPVLTGTKTVKVDATDSPKKPRHTGVELRAGHRFVLVPDPDCRWSGGGSMEGKQCDYRGYGTAVGWMQFKYQVGDGEGLPVVSGAVCTATQNGELVLYPEDMNPDGNTGHVTVKVSQPR